MAELVDMALWDTWIETCVRDSQLPAVQGGWPHQQLLDLAWEQVVRVVAPLLITARPSFFREEHDITLVADVAKYDFPERAMLRKLHLASLLDTNGQVGKLTRLEPGEYEFFFRPDSGHPTRITVHDTQIELNPPPSAADILIWPTLRTWIHRRPNRFVRATDDGSGLNPARAARVSVAPVAGLVTYTTNAPSSFAEDSEHDFFSQVEPYRRVATEVPATAATTNTSTFATATAALLVAGDYVCLKNETCLMPVPVDFSGNIKDLVIHSIGKTQADKDAYEMSLKTLKSDIEILYPAAANPMTANPLVTTLHHSPFLRVRGSRGRRMVRD